MCIDRISSGKEFHDLGPYTLKARSAKVLHVVYGTLSVFSLFSERKPDFMVRVGSIKSHKYLGASLCILLKTSVNTLYLILR